MSVDRRREAIEPEHPDLPVVWQCERVSIARSTFYRHPAPETPLTLTPNGHARIGCGEDSVT